MKICMDGGGIYTLGQQPDSVIEGNYIYNQVKEYAGIYLDQGSYYFMVKNNVVDTAGKVAWLYFKGKHNKANTNYVTNTQIFYDNNSSDSTDNTLIIENTVQQAVSNWSVPAQQIINNSGMREKYRYLTQQS